MERIVVKALETGAITELLVPKQPSASRKVPPNVNTLMSDVDYVTVEETITTFPLEEVYAADYEEGLGTVNLGQGFPYVLLEKLDMPIPGTYSDGQILVHNSVSNIRRVPYSQNVPVEIPKMPTAPSPPSRTDDYDWTPQLDFKDTKGCPKKRSKRSFTCDREGCDVIKSDKKAFLQHVRSHDSENIKCQYCSFVSHSLVGISRHERQHKSSKKLIVCPRPDCDFTTHFSAMLPRHMARHSDSSSCVCQHCGFRSAFQSVLAKHKRDAHSTRHQPSSSKQAAQPSSVLQSHCFICKINVDHYYIHVATVHGEAALTEELSLTGGARSQCALCGLEMFCEQDVTAHKRLHGEVVKPDICCPICPLLLPDTKLPEHLERDHSLQCLEQTTKTPKRNSQANEGLQYECTLCVRRLSLEELADHELEEQRRQQPDEFSSGRQLVEFLASQLESPAQHPGCSGACPLCETIAPDSASLLLHMRSHLPVPEPLSSQPCLLCGEMVQLPELNEHISSSHPTRVKSLSTELATPRVSVFWSETGAVSGETVLQTEDEVVPKVSSTPVSESGQYDHLSPGDFVEIDGELYKIETMPDASGVRGPLDEQVSSVTSRLLGFSEVILPEETNPMSSPLTTTYAAPVINFLDMQNTSTDSIIPMQSQEPAFNPVVLLKNATSLVSESCSSSYQLDTNNFSYTRGSSADDLQLTGEGCLEEMVVAGEEEVIS